MKIGLEIANEYVAGKPARLRFEELLEQVALAREFGFDSIFVGQHFLTHPLQTIQPIPLLGRLAAEVGDMWLGTGIILLPLFHPVDVAEQIATLDTITNGKLIFGVGLGYEEEEFQAFGIDRKHRVGRFEESLEIIKGLWTDDSVTYHGQHFSLTDAVPTNRPAQKPHPPIWIAANNHPAVRRAARMGDVLYASPHAHISTLEEQIGIYNQALKEIGKAEPEHIAVLRDCFVAETTAAAFEVCEPYIGHRYNVYVDQGQDKELPSEDTWSQIFEDLARDRFIIGDPETCVRELKRYEALGYNYIILEFQWADMDGAMALNCLRLLGEEVLPRVR